MFYEVFININALYKKLPQNLYFCYPSTKPTHMKKTIFILFIFYTSICCAQHAVFIEVGGSGGLGSLNYEKRYKHEQALSYALRVGFSLAPVDKNNGTALVFPLMINGLYGKSSHKMELGLGQTISVTTKGSAFIMGIARWGYRFEPENRKYFLSVAYTPIISYLLDFQWQHWGGIGIGFKLNSKR